MLSKIWWSSLTLGNTARLCASMVTDEPLWVIGFQWIIVTGLVYFTIDAFTSETQ